MDITRILMENGYTKQASILKKMRKHSIQLVTTESYEGAFRMGESKIGGCPHLPSGVEWPKFNNKSLAFIAQINLEQTSKYDLSKLLPNKGILYMFHEGGESVWGFDPKDTGGFKVIYYSGELSQLSITNIPDDLEDYLTFKPCKITFSSKNSYPSDIYDIKNILEITDEEEFDKFSELYEEHFENGIINKLLGYPELIQGDIFLESQLATNGLYCGDSTGYDDPKRNELEKGVSDWILLFQIDSDDNAGMMWGDVGRIYFVIRKEDLGNLRFDKIWAVFQCC